MLISHMPECEQVGTRRVKGTGPRDGGDLSNRETALEGGDRIRTDHAGYVDSDGTETIPAYNCAPGCPVAELDRQSGELHGHGSKRHSGSDKGMFDWGTADREQTGGESGGASRFFPVFEDE